MNPKEGIGQSKARMSLVPANVMMEVALGMREGAIAYGEHSFRHTRVKASTYYDAAQRHLASFWEGQDHDKASGVPISEISKAIANLVILRDAQMRGAMDDDRPPPSPEGWLDEINNISKLLGSPYPKPEDMTPGHTGANPGGD